jgi:hypothetical protein
MKRSSRFGSLAVLALTGLALLIGAAPGAAQSSEGPSLRYSDFGRAGAGGDLRAKSASVFVPPSPVAVAGKQADLLVSAEIDPNRPLLAAGRERFSNPDIAVGPDDILVVAGNRLMRIPNPNATGMNLPYTAPTAGDPGTPSPSTNLNALRAGVPTSEINLDTWVGPAVLNDVCPGQYNPQTCLVQYPTVRYDQLHGHFLVAFAITDTGVRGPDSIVTQGRASTWVLLVSRKASFVNPDGTVPAQVFSPPMTPPSVAGPEAFTADWYIHYGTRDGAGPTGFLNLNMYSTHPAAQSLSAPGRYSAAFPESNCNAPVGLQPPLSVSDPVGEETVCLLPTEVRLGVDGDSVILVSPVVNANQIVPNSNTIDFTTGRYAGNRVRVLSKFYLYNFEGGLTNGDPFVPGPYTGPTPYTGNVPSQGYGFKVPAATQWDMYRDKDLPAFCSVFDFAADTCTTTVAGFPPRRYTLGLEVSPTGSGIDNPRPPATPTTLSALYPLYYEPAHLRGRAMADYSNYPYGGYTHLLGSFAFGTVGSGGNLWVQPIVYRPDYAPALDAGDQTAIGIDGPRRQLAPDTVINPLMAPQDVNCSTAPCSGAGAGDPENNLYVGDSRPRRAIYRDGFLYDARTGRPSSNIFGTSIVTPPSANVNTANSPLWSTVYYDAIQTIYTSPTPALPALGSTSPYSLPLPNPSLIFYSFWQNGHFFSPMFDVTANVRQFGAASPSSLLPFFEKLFVGTTTPRTLFPSTAGQGNVWPSLFDMREGIDKFDRFEFFRDPVSGRVVNPLTQANTTNLLTTRQGASTDPILGGLWTYGTFADSRIASVGQWATHASYYDMTFRSVDDYGNSTNYFADVCPVGEVTATCLVGSPFFVYIQTARQLGLTQYLYGPGGAPLEASAIDPAHGIPGSPVNFQPGRKITRAEMAALIVYGSMSEKAVQDYLAKAGGGSTFTDTFTGAVGVDPDGNPTLISEAQHRAIEVLARRGYTSGCGGTLFCPFEFVTRGQMAVFITRAKENNVHPTLIRGCSPGSDPALCVMAGDNFWYLQQLTPYFVDVPPSHPFFPYIQKLRELRITAGTGPGTFSPDANVTRDQMMTVVTRTFFF